MVRLRVTQDYLLILFGNVLTVQYEQNLCDQLYKIMSIGRVGVIFVITVSKVCTHEVCFDFTVTSICLYFVVGQEKIKGQLRDFIAVTRVRRAKESLEIPLPERSALNHMVRSCSTSWRL